MRIALIDDETHARESIRLLLERHCPEVSVVFEGGEGDVNLELLKAAAPDLVIMDLTLAALTKDLFSRLRSTFANRLLILTAHEAPMAGHPAGGLPVLLKPVDGAELKVYLDTMNARKVDVPHQTHQLKNQ